MGALAAPYRLIDTASKGDAGEQVTLTCLTVDAGKYQITQRSEINRVVGASGSLCGTLHLVHKFLR
jgi:hypothetical protein